MSLCQKLLAVATISLTAFAASPASSQTLRYANQGELKSLDPYTLNESTTHAHLGQVYEGLIARDKDLKIVPGLAESWETPEPTRWRFHLRKDVKFHNGDPFTADDVVFSADRVRAQGSNLQAYVGADVKVVKVDDYTVDFVLTKPNPILHSLWNTWYIMDKKWCEENNAAAPTPVAATTPSYASLHENGTGPFTIESHQPGVKTVFKANPNWWRKPEHNLKEIVFTPIGNEADAGGGAVVAARSTSSSRCRCRISRASMPAPMRRCFPVRRSEPSSSAWTRCATSCSIPTSRARIRSRTSASAKPSTRRSTSMRSRARVMRGMSTPSALMVAPEVYPLSKDFVRPKADPEAAKKLLTEAGYPDGFEVTMDCPNDRYVNDAAICQAVVGMLARIGVKVDLLAQPKALYFAKILKPGGYKTSFYLLGWTPGTLDSHDVMYQIMGCRDDPNELARRGQCLRLLQQGVRQADRRGVAGERYGQARPVDQAGLRDRDQGLRLHPAASAGAGLGHLQEAQGGAARRQPGAALLDGQAGGVSERATRIGNRNGNGRSDRVITAHVVFCRSVGFQFRPIIVAVLCWLYS